MNLVAYAPDLLFPLIRSVAHGRHKQQLLRDTIRASVSPWTDIS